jgi:hypothetical protein
MDTDREEQLCTRSIPVQLLEQYARVAEEAAKQIVKPGAFAEDGVSLDANDQSTELWTAVKHDVLGWVTRAADEILTGGTHRPIPCDYAALHIGRRIYHLTGRSMIEINDADGCMAAATALLSAAAALRSEYNERKAEESSYRIAI